MTRIVACGSRRFTNQFQASLHIDGFFTQCPEKIEVIVGGATGADSMIEAAARRNGHTVTVMEADWETYGKKAGILRNLQMLDRNPDIVVAWWDGKSRGTKHTVEEARRRGIPVQVYQS